MLSNNAASTVVGDDPGEFCKGFLEGITDGDITYLLTGCKVGGCDVVVGACVGVAVGSLLGWLDGDSEGLLDGFDCG